MGHFSDSSHPVCYCQSYNSLLLPVSVSLLLIFKVAETTERINLEKLRAREQIVFFDEVLLFEDELHDHGVSMISVKIVSAVLIRFTLR